MPSWSPACSVSYFTAPNVVAHGEGKEDTPILSVENGTEDTAGFMERQSEECWSTAENQREWRLGSGWDSQVERGRSCSKNRPAQMGTRDACVGRNNRRKENSAKEFW